MDENPHYGELAKESVVHLRQMFNFQVEEYRFVTDEYSIVKLTEKRCCSPGSTGANRDEDGEGAEKQAAGSSKRAAGARSFSRGSRIYGEGRDALRGTPRAAPRDRIRRKNVPPYIVFSDKTLTHMCILKPVTEAEMLEVSAWVQYKFEKIWRTVSGVRAEVLGES